MFEIHYAPTGRVETDQSQIGLVFAPSEPRPLEVQTGYVDCGRLQIPPGVADYCDETRWNFNCPVLILALYPHMHMRGKSMMIDVIPSEGPATGRPEVLLNVPKYDFQWQGRYEPVESYFLPFGKALRCSGHFDNSAANPNNPDPSATVKHGPQTTDEMLLVAYDYVELPPKAPPLTHVEDPPRPPSIWWRFPVAAIIHYAVRGWRKYKRLAVV